MKFGVMFANPLAFAKPDEAAILAEAAEASGFESLWTIEHPILPAGHQSRYPYNAAGMLPGGLQMDLPDPMVWLSFVAARTTTIRLATGVLILPLRSPAMLAKEAATLDVLSKGRVTLGVGVGWLAEEFAAIGVPFARRGPRLESYVGALRRLWTEEAPTINDEFVSIEQGICRPRPAQASIPIVIGGQTEAAAVRAGRLGDGFFPLGGDLEHLVKIARTTAERHGRDPEAIEVTTGIPRAGDPVEGIKRLADIGVSRILLPPPSPNPDSIGAALARFADDVIGPVSRSLD